MWICDNRRVLPGFGADLYGFYRDPAEWREGGGNLFRFYSGFFWGSNQLQSRPSRTAIPSESFMADVATIKKNISVFLGHFLATYFRS